MTFLDDVTKGLGDVSNRAGQTEDALKGKKGGDGTAPGDFKNGEDLTAAPGDTAKADVAVGPGGNALQIPELIELIHFGTVYRDDAARFPSEGVADDASDADVAGSPGAHGAMMRAALHRETLLLGGFVRGQMAALVAEEKTQGSVGTMMALASELFGAAGGFSDKPTASDFQPVLEEIKKVGEKLNGTDLGYPDLHEAGIALHEARAAYAKLLAEQLEKRLNKKSAPGTGLLDAVPLLSSIVPPFLADAITFIQKIAFKVFDVYAALLIQVAIEMEPKIEEAARDMSIDAIRKTSRPLFPVWFVPPPPGEATPEDVIPSSAVPGPLAGALGGAIGAINDAGNTAQEVVDFLSRPGGYTPGSEFLDQAFQIPKTATRASTNEASLEMSDALGQIVVATFEKVLDVKLPDFVKSVLGKLMTVTAEFLRATYGKLITLRPGEAVTVDELLAAGRVHVVHLVVEKLLGLIPGIDAIKGFPLGFNGVSVNAGALLARGKELIAKEIAPALDPVIEFAMRDLYEMIFAARSTAATRKAETMEVYLGLLPALYARLIRNIFFPVWDLLMEKGLAEVTRVLGWENQQALEAIHAAKGQVDMVRDKMGQVSSLLSGTSFSADKGEKNLDPFKKLIEEPAETSAGTVPDPLADAFPLPSRQATAKMREVTDDELEKVKPNLKWQEAPPAAPAGGA